MRFDEISGAVCTFRPASNHSNGNTVDRQGRLVTCEHGARRVTLTDFDGSIRVLADQVGGRRFNSPNDVVVKSDGSIWFSDPTYGIDSDYFGNRSETELDGACVYQLDPRTSTVKTVIRSMVQPNGLAFSQDETQLFVVDSARTSGQDLPGHIRRFELGADGVPIDRGIVVEASVGVFDGIRLDDQDRIWAGTGEGVHCYAPDGRLLGKILTGGPIINLCFGGPKRNVLYMCGPREVSRVPVRARGQDRFLQERSAS
jgi:gluconolactonase